MPGDRKLIIIGFDGADPGLIARWLDELPGFRALAESGCWGPLRSTPNMNSASAWSTFATGKNPGKHGIFYFDDCAVDNYEMRFINASFRKGPTFWRLASDAGLNVQVINVPISFPAEPVNGLMVAGMDAPGVSSRGFTHPPGLVNELNRVTGGYLVESGVPGYIKAGNRRSAVKRMRETMDCRLKASLHLMKNHPWELFVTVFTEIDVAQHFFWHGLMPGHPEHRDDDPLKDTVKEIYTESDRCLQKLLEEAERAGATVMIVSDHGGGINTRGNEMLNPWLEAAGFLRRSGSGAASRNPLGDAVAKAASSGFKLIDRTLNREAKLALARWFPALRRRVQSGMVFQGIDWDGTRAFSAGARDEIWINTKGRHPRGTVEPGGEYDALVNELRESLAKAADPDTGEGLVEGVRHRSEVYNGPYADRAPDILVRWRQTKLFSAMSTKSAPAVRMPPAGRATCTGGHSPDGILFARGGGIAAGGKISGASIQDVAPTALALLGIPVPEDMDGAAAPAIVKETPKTSPAHSDAKEEQEYTEEEKKIIEDRLRGMGYIS
ncbi:MAG: alkaline phosphatase family protein [bacterium]